MHDEREKDKKIEKEILKREGNSRIKTGKKRGRDWGAEQKKTQESGGRQSEIYVRNQCKKAEKERMAGPFT